MSWLHSGYSGHLNQDWPVVCVGEPLYLLVMPSFGAVTVLSSLGYQLVVSKCIPLL